MFTRKNKRDFYRILPFGLIWVIYAIVYFILEKGLLHNLEAYPSTGNPYSFGPNTLILIVVGGVSGLIMGTLEIKVFSNLFTRQSFGKKLLYKTSLYVILMIVFVIIISAFDNSIKLKTSVFDKEVWINILEFLSSYTFWAFQLYLALMIGTTLFYSEASENIGMAVLRNFFIGKYHKPIQEERIFMFLDMKSSTTIAEKIGHVKYFEMLSQYYSDLSDPIIEYRGEVYQYVGDEIVVSWKLNNGLQDNNCLKCFFAMKDSIKDRSEKYQSKFQILPSFKAGFHYGTVTTGEIGVLKKDIVFSGDVLNTTARIQGLCNSYNVEVLISDQLMNKMNIESDFEIKSEGKNKLRGRNETIELFSVKLKKN